MIKMFATRIFHVIVYLIILLHIILVMCLPILLWAAELEYWFFGFFGTFAGMILLVPIICWAGYILDEWKKGTKW